MARPPFPSESISRRSLLALGGAAAVTGGLAACSGGGSSAPSSALSAGAKASGTIRILDDNTNTIFSKGVIADFEKDTGITVKYEQANFNDLHDRLSTLFSAQDSSYDVVMTWAAWSAEFGNAGWLQPLAKNTIPAAVLPAALDAVSYNGTVYGLPKFASAQTMFWNKDLFDKAGLDADTGPQSWDEFVDAAKKLTSGGVYGFAADMGNTDGAYQNFLKVLLLNDGVLYDESNKPAFNSTKGIDALQRLAGLLNDSKVMAPSTMQLSNSSDLGTLFGNKKAAIVFNWPFQYAAAAKAFGADSLGNDILPGIAVRSASIDGSEGFAVSNFSKNKAAALKWLQYVTTAPVQTEMVAKEGWLPVTQSLLEDSAIVKTLPVVPTYKKESEYEIKRYGSPWYTAVTEELATAITTVMLGKATAATALNGAATKASAIIAKYKK